MRPSPALALALLLGAPACGSNPTSSAPPVDEAPASEQGLEFEDPRALAALERLQTYCGSRFDCWEHELPGGYGPRPAPGPETVRFIEEQKAIARQYGTEIVVPSSGGRYTTQVLDDLHTMLNGYCPAPGDLTLDRIQERMQARPGAYLAAYLKYILADGPASVGRFAGLHVCDFVLRFAERAPVAFRQAAERAIPLLQNALAEPAVGPPEPPENVTKVRWCLDELRRAASQ